MFQSKIRIDLPSRETIREKSVGEWFTSLFGARPDLRTGREVMTISAYAVLEGIVTAFASAGMTNVISLMVDNRTVFLDTQDVPDDLAAMHHVAKKSGALNRRFREMHLAFTHREQGMHVIIDIALKPQVMLGDEELVITLSGRLEELRHQDDEPANRYRSRIREFVSDTDNFDRPREILDDITERLVMALRSTLPGARNISASPSEIQLTRPDAKQMGRMRNLRFDGGEHSRYRPTPARYREGVSYDPFYHYYYDPFYDFALFVMVGAAVEFAWDMSYLSFVDPYGGMLGYASDIAFDTWTSDWDAYDTMHFADDGSLFLDDSIPAFEYEGDYDDFLAYDAAFGMEPAEIYDPVGDGFIDAGWDTEPINYSDGGYIDTGFDTDTVGVGDAGFDDTGYTDNIDFASATSGDDFGGDDFGGDDFGGDGSGGDGSGGDDIFDSPISDWDLGSDDSSWDDGGDWGSGSDDDNW